MSDGALTLLILVIIVDLATAIVLTRVINRRGYTGQRKTLLMALTWLVPAVGAFCAALIVWALSSEDFNAAD